MEQNNGEVVQVQAGKADSRPLWRRLLAVARTRTERALHPRRRRRARERVVALHAARSVLFVCHGNIYRSPFGAACFAEALRGNGPADVRVGSAGFVGPNRPSPADAQRLAHEYGLDLSEHRSQLLNGSLLAEWDVIVVMSALQVRMLAEHFGVATGRILILGDLDPQTSDRREIADPWSAPELILSGSYARVERCVRVLAELAASSWGALAKESEPRSASPVP